MEDNIMRRYLNKSLLFAAAMCLSISAFAQADRLAGRWEGKTQSPQGERATTATFKKEGDAYVGTITGQRGEMSLKDIKLDGDKVTAKAEVETPQGALTINYAFTLQGDALKGTGSLNFGGNPFSFDVDLKRNGTTAAPAAQSAAPPAAQSSGTTGTGTGAGNTAPPARPQRPNIPQPQQPQSLDYFVGQWSFKYIGRESGFGPAPREGVLNLTKRADRQAVEGTADTKHDGGVFKESYVITFDQATKTLNFSVKQPGNVSIKSIGDWSSPIAIRFKTEPVKVKGVTLQLRRTLNIIAAHSFSIADELSEDGGPFVRLGSAVFSKVAGQ
jgi:hypothetical protein